MIFVMVIYVTLINLTEMEYYFVCVCFRIFNFGQIKMIFRGVVHLKKSLLQM